MKMVQMQIKPSGSQPGLLSLHGYGDHRNFRQNLVDQGFEDGEEVVIVSKKELDELLRLEKAMRV